MILVPLRFSPTTCVKLLEADHNDGIRPRRVQQDRTFPLCVIGIVGDDLVTRQRGGENQAARPQEGFMRMHRLLTLGLLHPVTGGLC